MAVNKERQTTPRNVYQEKGSNSASAKHKHRCGVVLVHMFPLLHFTCCDVLVFKICKIAFLFLVHTMYLVF